MTKEENKIELALSLFKESKTDEAIEIFMEILQNESEYEVVAYNNLAACFFAQKKYEQALVFINKAIAKSETLEVTLLDNYRQIKSATQNSSDFLHSEKLPAKEICFQGDESFKIEAITWCDLAKKLNFVENFAGDISSYQKNPQNWKMENDDAPILRYIYRNLKPKRHLEFGTWQGYGVNLALEESNATVWTINMPFGEKRENNESSYGHDFDRKTKDEIYNWASRVGFSEHKSNDDFIYSTDSIGFIGRFYLDKNYGNRVCQIYSNSIDWQIENYPEGFFDSVLIDGGHDYKSVQNDTKKALKLVKDGGLVMWHDFCPSVDFSSSIDVVSYICKDRDFLNKNFQDLFWVYPSFVLVGIKGEKNSEKKFISLVDKNRNSNLLIKILPTLEVQALIEAKTPIEEMDQLPQNQILQCKEKELKKKKSRFFRNIKRILKIK